MSKRPRCFYCGVGLSEKHRPKRLTKEQRLVQAIFNRLVCKRCVKAGRL